MFLNRLFIFADIFAHVLINQSTIHKREKLVATKLQHKTSHDGLP
jgi:hypothetical protein